MRLHTECLLWRVLEFRVFRRFVTTSPRVELSDEFNAEGMRSSLPCSMSVTFETSYHNHDGCCVTDKGSRTAGYTFRGVLNDGWGKGKKQ
jgi:hypothetical protein